MGEVLLLLVVALTVAAVVFGVTVLVTGRDPGLAPAEPDGRAVPLPGVRPLRESDVGEVRFDTALRGYRMDQVDQALRRTAYDIGYKAELVGVLEAEVAALREGRTADADALRLARERSAAAGPAADVEPDAAADAGPDAAAGVGPGVVPVDDTAAVTTGSGPTDTPGRPTGTPGDAKADPDPDSDSDSDSDPARDRDADAGGAPVGTTGATARRDDTGTGAGEPSDAVDDTGRREPAARSESA